MVKLLLNANEVNVKIGLQGKENAESSGNPFIPRDIDTFRHHKKFKHLIKTMNKIFNKTTKEPAFMEIVGGGPFLNCHLNSNIAEKFLNSFCDVDEYRRVQGYNICGYHPVGDNAFFSLEHHSVVKHLPTGDYIDFTEDFRGAKKKWFFECDLWSDEYVNIKFHNMDRLMDLICFPLLFRGERLMTHAVSIGDVMKIVKDYHTKEKIMMMTTKIIMNKKQQDLYSKYCGEHWTQLDIIEDDCDPDGEDMEGAYERMLNDADDEQAEYYK